jgi:uncharacterized protein
MAVVSVPPINRRISIPQAAIDDIVKQIVAKFHPLKVILFGSYAYGSPRPESDVDLLVIMPTKLKEMHQALLIQQSLEMDLFGLDLIVRTPETLTERIALGDSFLKEILAQGKVLYEVTHD